MDLHDGRRLMLKGETGQLSEGWVHGSCCLRAGGRTEVLQGGSKSHTFTSCYDMSGSTEGGERDMDRDEGERKRDKGE